MKKRLISFVLCVGFICCLLPSTAAARNETINEANNTMEEEYLVYQLFCNHGIHIEPTESYCLKDVSGNESYCCIEFTYGSDEVGFGVIDLTDYTLTMYSLSSTAPFSKSDEVICAGPLSFAIVDKSTDSAVVLGSNNIVAVDKLLDDSRATLELIDVETKARIINELKDEIAILETDTFSTSENAIIGSVEASSTYNVARSSEIVVNGGTDTNLVYSSGNNSGTIETDCGINAIAMYLRHMDNYFGGGYVKTSHNTEEKLKVALANICYDMLAGTTTSLSYYNVATLTNEYADYHEVTSTNVSRTAYSWTIYKNQIDGGDGMPCILLVPGGATSYWDTGHYVVGVGHTANATASSGSLLVNSGFISLKYVYIGTATPNYIVY